MDNNKTLSVKACRVCLATKSRKYLTMNNQNGWLLMFEYCFGLQIPLKDEARTICGSCAKEVQKFVKLKRMCLEVDAMWKATFPIKQEDNSVIVKTEKIYEKLDLEETIENVINFEPVDYDNDPEKHEIENEINFEPIDYVHDEKECETDKEKVKSDIEVDLSDHTLFSPSQEFPTEVNITKKDNNRNDSESQSKYVEPIEVENKEKTYSCKCGKSYVIEDCFLKHIETCKRNKTMIVKKKNNDGLQNKIQKEDNILGNCGLCDFPSRNTEAVKKHLAEHLSRTDLECKLCTFIARDFAEMASHRYSHQSIKMILRCHLCLKRCGIQKKLQFHFRSVHLKKKGGWCSYCDMQLGTYKGWRDHEKKHSDDHVFICDCCGLRFPYRCEIEDHLALRAGRLKCVCNFCGKTFSRKSGLNSHIANIHTEQKSVQCPHCDKKVKSYILKKHIQYAHGEKRFVCEVCSEAFKTSQVLQYHMLGHTNQRPYACDLCGVSYKTKCTLKEHLMKHDGLKPFECKECYKRFVSSVRLKRHSSVHTRVRRFKCDHCDRSFHSKPLMLQHCNKVHK